MNRAISFAIPPPRLPVSPFGSQIHQRTLSAGAAVDKSRHVGTSRRVYQSADRVKGCASSSEMAPSQKRQKKDTRCSWCLSAPDYISYHDEEWGVPLYDDQKVFEFLILETFQAGLSWLTILRKREGFAEAFHNFDVEKVAEMTEQDVARLLQDTSIVRNKLKIRAAISNAKAVIKLREEGIGFADYFWRWVEYEPQKNFLTGTAISKNELSDEISADLKKRGFKFVGSTVIYAHLQATGVVNDHVPSCPRFTEVQALVKPEKNL